MLKINKTYTGTTLKGRLISDDLVSRAEAYWEILDENGRVLENGNATIDGELYKRWDGSAESAYLYMAQVLGLEVVKFMEVEEEAPVAEETQEESTDEQAG